MSGAAGRRVGTPPRLVSTTAAPAFLGHRAYHVTRIDYDANGNTIAESRPDGSVVSYTWDGEDRLVGLQSATESEGFAYDADGLRRRRVTAAGTTESLWDGQNLLAELDEGLATTARQTDFPGWWGGLSSRWTAAGSEHYTHDLSANTRQVLDGSGAATATAVYTAFGTALAAADGPVGFGGQVGYYQDETERLYVRARHYRPGVGRWMARDPLGRLGGASYGYGSNAPVGRLDPTGLDDIRACAFNAAYRRRNRVHCSTLIGQYGALMEGGGDLEACLVGGVYASVYQSHCAVLAARLEAMVGSAERLEAVFGGGAVNAPWLRPPMNGQFGGSGPGTWADQPAMRAMPWVMQGKPEPSFWQAAWGTTRGVLGAFNPLNWAKGIYFAGKELVANKDDLPGELWYMAKRAGNSLRFWSYEDPDQFGASFASLGTLVYGAGRAAVSSSVGRSGLGASADWLEGRLPGGGVYRLAERLRAGNPVWRVVSHEELIQIYLDNNRYLIPANMCPGKYFTPALEDAVAFARQDTARSYYVVRGWSIRRLPPTLTVDRCVRAYHVKGELGQHMPGMRATELYDQYSPLPRY